MQAGKKMSDAEWQQYWKEYWDKARNLSKGRWGSILGSLAAQLSPALDAGGRRHVPCPVHGGTDGFRFFQNFEESGRAICNTCGHFHDGFAVLQWANGWSSREAVEEVMKHLTGDKSAPRPSAVLRLPPKVESKPKADNDDLRRSLNRVWQRSYPMKAQHAEPGRLYLAKRGLTRPAPPSLRFHPSLAYHDGDKVIGYMPALVAVVQGIDGCPVTIHRTFLDADGNKASVDSPKKLMAYPDDIKIIGGAIRLAEAGKVLGVGEGIETCLAATEGTGIPVWSTVNATMLERFEPPDGVEMIIVFADKDRPTKQHPRGHGQEAAKRLVARMWERGIKATAITPSGEIPDGEKSLDWLDVLKRDGVRGFPALTSVRMAMLRAA